MTGVVLCSVGTLFVLRVGAALFSFNGIGEEGGNPSKKKNCLSVFDPLVSYIALLKN